MKDPEEVLHTIALLMVPQIGSIQGRILLEHFGTARKIFSSSRKLLEKMPGIGEARASNILAFRDFAAAEKELEFIDRYQVMPLMYNADGYPKRLRHCADPPLMLFYKGNADLNTSKVLAVVGTRKHTEYGRKMAEELITHLAGHDILILSGLAYGIDHQAHRSALRTGLPTVGVLANGLDIVYPSIHTNLAREMTQYGGLLTEFLSGTQPDKQNFPRRNRIVAGACDALLVVETDVKGGSMITAEIASGYNRQVFAFPGKVTDKKSSGCNQMLRDQKAQMILEPMDLLRAMNWDDEPLQFTQTSLFPQLEPHERNLLEYISLNEPIHLQQLYGLSGLTKSAFHTALLNLELEGAIVQLPGSMVRSAG